MHNATPTGLKPLWVRPAEATRLTGIGTTQLYELIGNGTIKSKKVGRKRLILYRSLELLGDEQEEEEA